MEETFPKLPILRGMDSSLNCTSKTRRYIWESNKDMGCSHVVIFRTMVVLFVGIQLCSAKIALKKGQWE